MLRFATIATAACRRASLRAGTARLLSSSSSAPINNNNQATATTPPVAPPPPLPSLPPRPAPPRHLSATPPSPQSDPRAAVARHGHQRHDQAREPRPPPKPQEDVELPAHPLVDSPGGPYAARPDRDPWPAPMPCLSREAGAGLSDESYSTMSGAVAGTHTPGAHHFEADGTDIEDDDRCEPPTQEPLEMGREDAQKAYPLDRDPSVGGGMATHPRPKGTQLPPDL